MVDLTPEEVQEVAQLLKRLAAETEALVAANWPAILRVAEALLERPLLSEADLDRLIAGGASRRRRSCSSKVVPSSKSTRKRACACTCCRTGSDNLSSRCFSRAMSDFG
jgi:hypothetical protein